MPAIERYLEQADDELAETPALTALLESAARVESRGIKSDAAFERAGQLIVDLGAAIKQHAAIGQKFKKPITYIGGRVDAKIKDLRDRLATASVNTGRIHAAREQENKAAARKEAKRIEDETRKRLEAQREKEARELEAAAKAAAPADRKDLRDEAAARREEPVKVAPVSVVPAARKVPGTREVTRWKAVLIGDTDEARWSSLVELLQAVVKGQIDDRAVLVNWEWLHKQAGPEMNRKRMGGAKALPFPGVRAVSLTKTETTGRRGRA